MIRVDGRLLDPDGVRAAVGWGRSAQRGDGAVQGAHSGARTDSVAGLSTGQLVTQEFYALGKLVRLALGLALLRRNTTLCMASADPLATSSASAPTARPAATRTSSRPTGGAGGAQTSPTTTRRHAPVYSGAKDRQTLVPVDPRVTESAMIRDIHLPVRPRGDVASLNSSVLVVLIRRGLVELYEARARIDGVDGPARPPLRLECRAAQPGERVVGGTRSDASPAGSGLRSAARSPGPWASTTRSRARTRLR